ncbi:unnamed protein product [Caenorhabditis sp. 36 PRJEB53466]|nr:unnamed protein product [Caenorhabditis sp. 36 PRJEB53466]
MTNKRQSDLEISTHLRLLPCLVAKQPEQAHLLRKRDQLRQWAIHPNLRTEDKPALACLLRKNENAIALSIKPYSEKRRKHFEKMTATFHQAESEFIKKIKSPAKVVVHQKLEKVEESESQSVLHFLITGIQSLCCGQHRRS